MNDAKFEVVKVDPEGSGMDWQGHLGKIVEKAKRCCPRCTIIFGTVGDGVEIGPFVRGELKPLNDEAQAVYDEIETFVATYPAKHVKT